MAEKLALSPIEDWYLKVDDIAMVALPPHLDSFMTRDDGGVYHTPLILSLSGEDPWLVSSACPVVSATGWRRCESGGREETHCGAPRERAPRC